MRALVPSVNASVGVSDSTSVSLGLSVSVSASASASVSASASASASASVCETESESVSEEVRVSARGFYGGNKRNGGIHAGIDGCMTRKFIQHTHKYINEYIRESTKLKNSGIDCVLH